MKRYTTKEVAERLGVTDARVRQLIYSGVVKAVKFGRDWTVGEEELERVAAIDRRPGPPRKYPKDPPRSQRKRLCGRCGRPNACWRISNLCPVCRGDIDI